MCVCVCARRHVHVLAYTHDMIVEVSVTTLYLTYPIFHVIHIERVLLGDNEGLYLLDITGDNLFKFGDRDVRKVSQIRVMQEDNLVAMLAGECGSLPWFFNI